ncbi:hypothetical protein [Halosimplex marinum]|uniref:hypothetical protein n=1 Tax=Halosimplex marinum TaxID=3396620 RepID=UPI003F572229
MTLLDDIDDGDLSAKAALLRETVPGYDYRVREASVETDRKLRDKIRRDLGETKGSLDDVSERLYRRGERDLVAAVDDLKADVERVRQRAATAPTGGGSVRDLAVEEEESLVALVEHDASLVAELERVDDATDDLRAEVAEAGGAVASRLRECEAAVADLDRAFTRRRDHMEGLEA